MKMNKPMPEDYGLYGDIDILEQLIVSKAIKEQRKRRGISFLLYILIVSVLIAIVKNSNNKPQIQVYIGIAAIILVGFLLLFLIVTANGKDILERDPTYKKIQEYKTEAIKYENDWNDKSAYKQAENKNNGKTTACTTPTLYEAAYMKAKNTYIIKVIKDLLVCAICAIMVFVGYAANTIWTIIGAPPGILAILFLVFLVWLRPRKEDPDTYKDERLLLLKTDKRFTDDIKIVFDSAAYNRDRNQSVLKILIALSLLAIFSYIASLAFDKDKWYLVYALLPAIWSFLYAIVIFYAWPTKDTLDYYKSE